MDFSLSHPERWGVVLARALGDGAWSEVEQLLPEVLKWAERRGHRSLCFQVQTLLADVQQVRALTLDAEIQSGDGATPFRSHPWEEGRGLLLLEELLKQLSHAEWLSEGDDSGLRQEMPQVLSSSSDALDSEWVFDMDLDIRPSLKGAI